MSCVDDYLSAMAAHDWPRLRTTLADDGLVRIGPFCDRVDGVDRYVDFLSTVIPSLRDYVVRVKRTSTVENRTFVEMSETFEVEGRLTEFPECILFEVDRSGKINHVSVFMMTPGGDAPVEGGKAVGAEATSPD